MIDFPVELQALIVVLGSGYWGFRLGAYLGRRK